MAFIALLVAVIFTLLLLPSFNQLVEKQMSLDLINPVHLSALILIGLICGLVAGSYPAFYLTSFNPIKVLKGFKVSQGTGAAFIRKGLVVTQFVISIGLIISTLIIYQQIQHTKNRELGLNKHNLIYFDQSLITTSHDGTAGTKFGTVQNALLSTGVVESVSLNSNTAFQVGSNSSNYNWKGKETGSEILIGMDWVTAGYIETMGIKLLSGKNFHPDGLSDSNSVIINESLAKMIMKNPAEAAGQIIVRETERFTIIGVMKDFVYNNIYGSVAPMIMYSDPSGNNTNTVNIRFKKGVKYETALKKVKTIIAGYNPGNPFEYKFFDEDFDKLFKTESLIGKLAFLFAGLAICISCLGLFGLAAYTAEKRNKEIGIRKILGASVPKIAAMLSADFLKLVALSCLISLPLSWWLMNTWLKDYEYRVAIQWWMFIIPVLLAMIIAIITVSTQAIRAAIANPVKSLRTE
jgi:putative ABC transport system permease protein